jgi:hypothetical protein
MKKLQTVSFGVVTIFILVSCSLFTPKGSQNDGKLGNYHPSVADIPVLDLEGPLPSPGAASLKALAVDVPGVAVLVDDVEASERAALQAAIEELQAQLPPTSYTQDFASTGGSLSETSSAVRPIVKGFLAKPAMLPVVYRPPAAVFSAEDGLSGLSAASIIGLLSSMFTDMFSIPVAFPTKSFTQTEKEGDVSTNMNMAIGKAEDGSSHFEMGMQSEGTKNGTAVKTDLSAVIDGQRCPTAEGQVSFSVKARIGSESGGTGTTQDLTTFVRAVVNDDGEIASTTFDLIQGTTQAKGGRTVYLETGETIKYGQGFTDSKESNWRVDQKTDNVNQEDVNKLEPPGLKAALELGVASLMSAQYAWQSGKCVKIEAPAPGKVEPGSTTPIPVKVFSIFDGADAPSKLKAALTGGASIDPTTLAKTPGTLTYTAPNEKGKSATILLTATSKRGKATLELNANTGEKKLTYHVIETPGAGGTWSGGCIDDLSKPFSVSFTGPGTTATYTISPSSSTSGSLVEKQHVALSGTTMDIEGKGSYTIIPTDKDPEGNLVGMEIVFSTTGKAKTCVGGQCVTTKMDSGKGVQIPLRVQDEPCP